jgi:outer membrane immunogenic protein
MSRVLIASFIATTTFSSVYAADLGTKKPTPVPVFAAFNWTGAYVGIDAGYLFGKTRVTVPAAPNTSASPEPQGFTLGGHVGYRYQLQNNIVLGAEGRLFANFGTRKSKDFVGFPGQAERIENPWGGDARITLGYAMDRFLPYIAGGLAFGETKGCFTIGGVCSANTSFSNTRVGWTLGAGVAYAFTNNLIARIEYTYTDLGRSSYTTAGLPGGITRVRYDNHAVRAGLSYKF